MRGRVAGVLQNQRALLAEFRTLTDVEGQALLVNHHADLIVVRIVMAERLDALSAASGALVKDADPVVRAVGTSPALHAYT